MAYVVTVKEQTTTTTGSETLNLPTHQDGDLVLVYSCAFFNTTVSGTLTTAWTGITIADAGVGRTWLYYNQASGGALTNPTVTSAVAGVNWLMVVVRGADTTTPVGTTNSASIISQGAVSALTLTDTPHLVLMFAGGERNAENPFIAANEGIELAFSGNAYNDSVGSVAYTYATNAEARTYTIQGNCSGSDSTPDLSLACVPIKDDGNGVIKAYPKQDASDLIFRSVGPSENKSKTLTDPTLVSASPQITSLTHSISGATFDTSSSTLVYQATGATTSGSLHLDTVHPSSAKFLTAAGTVQDVMFNSHVYSPSIDLSNSLIGISIGLQRGGLNTLDNFGTLVGFGDGTNASFFVVGGSDSVLKDGNHAIILNTADSATYEIETVGAGSVNWSAITTVYHGFNNVDVNFDPLYPQITKLDVLKILGGTSTFPASFVDFSKASRSGMINTVVDQGNTQFLVKQDLSIGDGSTDIYFDSSGQSVEFPVAYSYNDKRIDAQMSAGSVGLEIYATAGSTVNLPSTTLNFGNFHYFRLNASSSISAAYDFDGLNVLNAEVTLIDLGANGYSGLTFSGCNEINHTLSTASALGGVTISNCAETYAITVTSKAQFEALQNVTFSGNNVSIKITGNQTGTWSAAGMTVSGGGGSYDIEYTGTTDFTIEFDVGSGFSQGRVNNSSTGTLTVSVPTVSLTVTSNIAGSDIKIFETGTQTIEASATGTSASTSVAGTYDWTVQKAGYLPQRGTGVVLGTSSVPVSVTLIKDPVYSASHGLTYGALNDLEYNRTTKKLTCVTRQAGRDFYSAMIDAFIAQSSLDNTPFPLTAVGIDSIFFNDDAELLDATSEDNWFDAGIRYINSSGTTTAEWCSIKSSGSIPAGVTGRYQTGAGTGTTALRTTGAVNQIIQIYGDATHGNLDYRSYLVIKFQANPYVDTRSDILALAGVATLEPFEYSVAIEPTALDITAGDSGAVLTLVDHTAAPITVGGKTFSYEIQDGGTNSAEDILRAWDYNIAQTGTYQGTDTFNLPEFIAQSGSTYETRRGIVETEGDTLYGCYVSRGGSDHPGFQRFQSDDGTYYTPAVTANGTITDLVDAGIQADDRLQIENTTALSAAAWQASTVYSAGDIVKRTTGLGTENTAGLFFRCTTGGTSGGTEPTWVITTPGVFGTAGSETTDNTVTWECFSVLLYDADPSATSWSDSYIDGEEFASGETGTYRFAEMDEGTTFKKASATFITTSAGFTVSASSVLEANSVYAENAIDGSDQDSIYSPNYNADGATDYIVMDTNTDFRNPKTFAYYCYLLTTSEGMYNLWDAVTAIDAGNYRNNVDVAKIMFDETAGFVKQEDSDNSRWFNSDGSRPFLDPTTGGAGIHMNWKNPVYVTTVTGSNVITGDIADVAAQVQSGLTSQGYTTTRAPYLDKAGSLTFTVAGQVDSNCESMNGHALQGDGSESDKIRTVNAP